MVKAVKNAADWALGSFLLTFIAG